MNKPFSRQAWRTRSIQWQISALFVVFGLALTAGLWLQGTLNQNVIAHPIWRELLASNTAPYLKHTPGAHDAPLPSTGLLRGWRIAGATAPPDMPAFFATLAPGYYDEEATDDFTSDRDYAVLVTPIGQERIVMAVDITELEQYQNMTALASLLLAILSVVTIGASLFWLYRRLRRPMQALAQSMDQLDPEQPAQRLPVDLPLSELHDIAVLVNRHLERVERFIERERSLLDQASHEFRTPIAVIAGAVDVLRVQALPPGADAPLERIRATTDNLTEIMSALLYLSREPDGQIPLESTRVDALLAVLVQDHRHLLEDKPAAYAVGTLQPLWVRTPEAILRIVLSNLLRNAAENSYEGTIDVQLEDGRLSVRDCGTGFDTVAAARRYSMSLRNSTKQGGGQGLGLFLTRRICERFGWTLQISSTVSQGTLAELHFPVDASLSPGPDGQPPAGQGQVPAARDRH